MFPRSAAPWSGWNPEEDRSSYRFTVVPRAGGVRDYLAAPLTREGLTPFAQVRAALAARIAGAAA